MGAFDLAKYQEALKARESAVAQVLRRREGIAVGRNADAADDAQSSLEQELTAVALHRESRLLTDVRSALKRIASGDYGVCLRCEEAIGEKRLNAVPWAACCIRCQEAIDAEMRRDSEPPSDYDQAA
ncbi:MAG TPA: TraR/DksA family transcriptional regulator [Bryobacteraceae bacterium]|jgi:DnaK suppressor protein